MIKSKKNWKNDTEYEEALLKLIAYKPPNGKEDETYLNLNDAVIKAEKKASFRAKLTAYNGL